MRQPQQQAEGVCHHLASSMSLQNDLESLWLLQQQVRDVHPLLREHYYLCVATGRQLEVYRTTEGGYAHHGAVQLPITVPEGTLAAFAVEELGDAAAIVTSGALQTIDGRVGILHEFVHCFQWRTCELALRSELPVLRAVESDPTLELNYPMDYACPAIRQVLQSCVAGEPLDAGIVLRSIAAALSQLDYQYFVWQTWKEGFARFIENLIRKQVGVQENIIGSDPESVSRSSLYYLGEEIWKDLAREPPSVEQMTAVFHKMMDGQHNKSLELTP